MKLTKVRIVNWMYFLDSEFNLKGNAALTGDNGSGKTTLIDALQYAIIGSRQAVRFNSAQGDSKRDLESYVRGTVGAQDLKYLREDETISYILLQIEEEENTYIIGVAIEYNNSKLTERRFTIRNNFITDEMLKANNKFKTYFEFRDQFDKEDFKYFDNITEYQKEVSKILGFTRDTNYFKLLTKAIQLKSVENVNHFIRDYLLEKNLINIEEAQERLRNINKTSKSIQRNKNKRNALYDIDDAGYELKDLSKKIEYSENELNYFKYKLTDNQIISNEKSIIKKEKQILENKTKLESLTKSLNDNTNLISNLERIIGEKYPNLDSFILNIEKLNNKIEDNKMNMGIFDEIISNDILLIKKVNKEIFNKYQEIDKNKTILNGYLLSNRIQNFRDEISNFRYKVKYEVLEKEKKEESLNNNLANLAREIKELEKNQMVLPHRVKRMINILEENLYKVYHENVEVKTVSQYANINNSAWRDAIEGYLGNTRHHLVIAPKYFDEAVRIYDAYKHEIYGVKIIDGSKITHKSIKKGTLSEFIDINNITARNYLLDILNQVVYVDDINELNKYSTSITKDCLKYQNYGITKINPNIYKQPFIGLEAIKIQLKTKQLEYNNFNEELELLLTKLKLSEEYMEILKKLRIYDLKENHINSFEKYRNNISELNNITKEYNSIKKIPEYTELVFKIEEYREIIRNINDNITTNKAKTKGHESDIRSHDERITKLSEDLEIFKLDILKLSQILISQFDLKLKSNILNDQYIKKKEQSLNKLNNKLFLDKKDVETMMFTYNTNFNSHNIPKLENIDSYISDYDSIEDSQFKLEKHLVDYQSEFKEIILRDFLKDLHEQIEQTENIIKAINQNLKKMVFGGTDSYNLVYKPSNVPELKELYQIAKQSEIGQRSLLNSQQYDENLEKVEKILNYYMEQANNLDTQTLLDVRQYFEFDVIVDTHGVKKNLSEVLDTQSGGEKQVPFYILAAAAFEQSKDRRVNKHLCIVLFDEAFSNMDSQRIKTMLEFFKSFNIQIIVSVPGKIESIIDNVDTMLVALRQEKVAGIYDYNEYIS